MLLIHQAATSAPELILQEMNTIESSQKQKTQQYQLAKGALNTLQRKQQYVTAAGRKEQGADDRRGNLAQKSLIDVVKKGDLVEGSEYLETLLVAVPKCVVAENSRLSANRTGTTLRAGTTTMSVWRAWSYPAAPSRSHSISI